ncbi:MAG: hypothetical protein RLZ81_349 [Pseudomonadota bacterium]|jgi:hypothetical protein
MKELPTPTYPFSLLDLPMGSLPRLAPRNHALVASIRAFWSQLTRVTARQAAARDSTSR